MIPGAKYQLTLHILYPCSRYNVDYIVLSNSIIRKCSDPEVAWRELPCHFGICGMHQYIPVCDVCSVFWYLYTSLGTLVNHGYFILVLLCSLHVSRFTVNIIVTVTYWHSFLLAYLSWKLKWSFLIIRSPSICPSVYVLSVNTCSSSTVPL